MKPFDYSLLFISLPWLFLNLHAVVMTPSEYFRAGLVKINYMFWIPILMLLTVTYRMCG